MLFLPCGTKCRILRVLSLNAKLELSWYFVLFEFCEMRSKFTITILNNRARVHNTYMRFLLRTKVSIQIKETAVADSLINYRAYLCRHIFDSLPIVRNLIRIQNIYTSVNFMVIYQICCNNQIFSGKHLNVQT